MRIVSNLEGKNISNKENFHLHHMLQSLKVKNPEEYNQKFLKDPVIPFQRRCFCLNFLSIPLEALTTHVAH